MNIEYRPSHPYNTGAVFASAMTGEPSMFSWIQRIASPSYFNGICFPWSNTTAFRMNAAPSSVPPTEVSKRSPILAFVARTG